MQSGWYTETYYNTLYTILIYAVYVKCVKSKRMVKILYLLYHCDIHLCVQIYSVVFFWLWIMFLYYVPCSWCRRWLLMYCICVFKKPYWIKSFLLRCFPMYKICFWSSTTVLLEICVKSSYTTSTFQQYCVMLQVRNNRIEGYTISPSPQSVCEYWKDSSNFVLAILVNKYLSCTSQESCMKYRWKGTTNWSILLP